VIRGMQLDRRRHSAPVHISVILAEIRAQLQIEQERLAETDGQLALQLFLDGSPAIEGLNIHQDSEEP